MTTTLVPLPAAITEEQLPALCDHLAERDADLARIVANFGYPPLWARAPGFSTLVHIILEQQVSIASAKAAHDRLLALAVPLTPATLLALDDETFLAVGFSRQKRGYARALAQAIVTGQFDLDGLHTLTDEAASQHLLNLKGIGHWTADIYLLMVMCRPDVWPVGDLALQVAVQAVKGLSARPKAEEMTAWGEGWRPWRSVATRLLWHHYLNQTRSPRNP